MSSTVYSAPDQRKAGTRAPRDRQIVVALLALLATNGVVCWLNTLQQIGLLVPVVYVGNYALLGLWFGTFASVRTNRHLWGAVTVGLIVVASHVYLFVVRPAYFAVGWPFWLTNACELAMLGALVVQVLCGRRSASELRPELTAPLAQIVSIGAKTATVSAAAEVRRAA